MTMDKAQSFTLEGVMASLLLLVVMYTFFQSSLVVSPMWSEISDAQLRLLAYDALKILDNTTKIEVNGKYVYHNDSLQGLLANLIMTPDGKFEANDMFSEKLKILVYPAYIRLEVYWVERYTEGYTINGSAIKPFDSEPTPEAVAASRYIVMDKLELKDSFKNDPQIPDPVVFEVRLILWR